MEIKISHIAVACSELEPVIRRFQALGLDVEEEHNVPTEKVKVAMLPIEASEHLRLELLKPTEASSPIAGFLAKRPNGGLHHICFEVKNLEKWETKLKQAGMEILPPGIRPGARGKVLFIHPKSAAGVLVELEEIV